MTRKRFIKLVMSEEFPRNYAVAVANTVDAFGSYERLWKTFGYVPQVRPLASMIDERMLMPLAIVDEMHELHCGTVLSCRPAGPHPNSPSATQIALEIKSSLEEPLRKALTKSALRGLCSSDVSSAARRICR